MATGLASGRPRPQSFRHQAGRHAAAAQEQEQQDGVDHEERPRVAVEAEHAGHGEHRQHPAEHDRLRQPHQRRHVRVPPQPAVGPQRRERHHLGGDDERQRGDEQRLLDGVGRLEAQAVGGVVGDDDEQEIDGEGDGVPAVDGRRRQPRSGLRLGRSGVAADAAEEGAEHHQADRQQHDGDAGIGEADARRRHRGEGPERRHPIEREHRLPLGEAGGDEPVRHVIDVALDDRPAGHEAVHRDEGRVEDRQQHDQQRQDQRRHRSVPLGGAGRQRRGRRS